MKTLAHTIALFSSLTLICINIILLISETHYQPYLQFFMESTVDSIGTACCDIRIHTIWTENDDRATVSMHFKLHPGQQTMIPLLILDDVVGKIEAIGWPNNKPTAQLTSVNLNTIPDSKADLPKASVLAPSATSSTCTNRFTALSTHKSIKDNHRSVNYRHRAKSTPNVVMNHNRDTNTTSGKANRFSARAKSHPTRIKRDWQPPGIHPTDNQTMNLSNCSSTRRMAAQYDHEGHTRSYGTKQSSNHTATTEMTLPASALFQFIAQDGVFYLIVLEDNDTQLMELRVELQILVRFSKGGFIDLSRLLHFIKPLQEASHRHCLSAMDNAEKDPTGYCSGAESLVCILQLSTISSHQPTHVGEAKMRVYPPIYKSSTEDLNKETISFKTSAPPLIQHFVSPKTTYHECIAMDIKVYTRVHVEARVHFDLLIYDILVQPFPNYDEAYQNSRIAFELDIENLVSYREEKDLRYSEGALTRCDAIQTLFPSDSIEDSSSAAHPFRHTILRDAPDAAYAFYPIGLQVVRSVVPSFDGESCFSCILPRPVTEFNTVLEEEITIMNYPSLYDMHVFLGDAYRMIKSMLEEDRHATKVQLDQYLPNTQGETVSFSIRRSARQSSDKGTKPQEKVSLVAPKTIVRGISEKASTSLDAGVTEGYMPNAETFNAQLYTNSSVPKYLMSTFQSFGTEMWSYSKQVILTALIVLGSLLLLEARQSSMMLSMPALHHLNHSTHGTCTGSRYLQLYVCDNHEGTKPNGSTFGVVVGTQTEKMVPQSRLSRLQGLQESLQIGDGEGVGVLNPKHSEEDSTAGQKQNVGRNEVPGVQLGWSALTARLWNRR